MLYPWRISIDGVFALQSDCRRLDALGAGEAWSVAVPLTSAIIFVLTRSLFIDLTLCKIMLNRLGSWEIREERFGTKFSVSI